MSDSLQVRKSLNFSTRTLVDNWHSVESDRYPNNEAQSTPMATFKAEGCKNIDPVSNDVNAEVHALLSRLKQLVGKVNVNQFLDELKEVNTSGRSEESMSTDSESSDENIKKAEQPKARFALTSQQIAREHDRSNSSAGQVDERSRYMLGANRFSIRASQLPDDLLNYVSGTKLLRANTRTPNFTMSPDPYACLSSPGKPLQAASNPISLAAASLSEKVNTTSETTFENANFQEFCVIGVESDMLFGLKSLERSSLQPTEVSCVYPTATDRLALVSNLNDYCFPFGAELRYVTRKELDRLNALSNLDVNANGTAFHNSKQSYGLQYQIMQFTDTVGVVHYATCVISSEPLERVGRQLHENMDLLQKKTRASNTIKRYMFFFAYKRKVRENRELRAKWASNMRNAHISIDGSLSVGSGLSKTGKASRSFFKAMRRVMGGGAAFHPPHLASGHESSSGSGSTASGSTGSISEESDNESPAQASGRPRASTVSSSYSRNNLSFHLSSPATPPSPRSAGRFTGGIATLLGSPLQRQRTVQSKFKGRALFTDFCAPTVFAEVHVDGSPSMSRTAALKLAESDRKVAVITQKAYCIISSQPMHALFFQVRTLFSVLI